MTERAAAHGVGGAVGGADDDGVGAIEGGRE